MLIIKLSADKKGQINKITKKLKQGTRDVNHWMLGLFFPLKAAKVELGLTAASSERYYGTKFSRSFYGVHLGPFFFGLAYADLGWLIVSYRALRQDLVTREASLPVCM